MPSPFPGMDPYLEPYWGDIHHTMITLARGTIQDQLPDDLVARIDERTIPEDPRGGRSPSESSRSGYVQILERKASRKVVTVIEVLTPDDKGPVRGLLSYGTMREEWKARAVNFVEVDLLRCGTRATLLSVKRLPDCGFTPYTASCWRASNPHQYELFPIPLRKRLPKIPVPLRPDDADVVLDLQALIGESYESGGYDGDIDYRAEPEPPLTGEDARWADALLRERGLR